MVQTQIGVHVMAVLESCSYFHDMQQHAGRGLAFGMSCVLEAIQLLIIPAPVLFASLLPIMLLLADDLLDAAAAELSWGRGDSNLLLCGSWPPIALRCSIPDRVVTQKLYAGSLEILEMMAGFDSVTTIVSRIHPWLHY